MMSEERPRKDVEKLRLGKGLGAQDWKGRGEESSSRLEALLEEHNRTPGPNRKKRRLIKKKSTEGKAGV